MKRNVKAWVFTGIAIIGVGVMLAANLRKARQPDVFIVGDSITQGWAYQMDIHQMKLSESDRLWIRRRDENGFHTRYTADHLSRWLGKIPPKMVLWNNGLHDITRLDGPEGKRCRADLEEYGKNLEEIAAQLLALEVPVYFITTTPVRDELAGNRRNSDVIRYNEKARRTLEPLGVRVIDLNSFVQRKGIEDSGDGVHFDHADLLEMGKYVFNEAGLTEGQARRP